jgi:glucose/mannose transport system substrate-binding protein
MRQKLTRRSVFQLGLPLYLGGCAADAGNATHDSEGTDRTVELFSWWIAPSEADALDALVALHGENYPHEKIYNAAIESGAKAKEVLAERLAANRPPDLYQENAYNLAAVMAKNPGSLLPLTELFRSEGLFDAVVPEVINDVTLDGEIYSMPVNIHRENALHYNVEIFTELGLDVPTTLEELLATCETLKQAGITPLATSYQGWIQRVMFNSIAAASLGPSAFQSYFLGQSELDETAMGAAIDVLDNILTSYVNDSATDPEFRWTDAADLLLNKQAAMFIHGDWAKGYLTQLGWKPGVGFGVVGMPGATDLFLYGVDVFALLAGGPEPEAAKDFLKTVASKPGQAAFNKLKGSSPIRLDGAMDDLDVVGQGTLESLRNAKVRMLTRSKSVWDDAFQAFALTRDKDALLGVYRDNPPDK